MNQQSSQHHVTGIEIPQTPPLIEYRNVTVQRNARIALEDISLVIGAQERVAILGPNGSGKSSLIKTLTRELYPLARKGSFLRIYGSETWDVLSLRALLGVVSGDLIVGACRRWTLREIVLSGFFGSVGVWPNFTVSQDMERRADRLMERLEISHLAGENIDEVSSGETRRALIARALVSSPKALLLDEPTNSLDFKAVCDLRKTLGRLARDGTGLILVTHSLDDIIPDVDRIILLNRGRIVGDGSKRQMLTSEHLRSLYGMEVEVTEHEGFYHLWWPGQAAVTASPG